MKIKEIYALTPISETTDLYRLQPHLSGMDVDRADSEKNTRISVKFYANTCFDGRRTWELFSVWFDKKPVMLCQEAGREGRDHQACFITNAKRYAAMCVYIQTLLPEEEVQNVYSENYEDEELTNFYDCSLSDFYDPSFVPDLKAGDVLTVQVPQDHPRGYGFDGKYVDVRVRVKDVDSLPYSPYRVVEIDRVMLLLWDKNDTRPSIIDKKSNKNWKKDGYSEIYLRLGRDHRVQSG